jgi:hypothetical protein
MAVLVGLEEIERLYLTERVVELLLVESRVTGCALHAVLLKDPLDLGEYSSLRAQKRIPVVRWPSQTVPRDTEPVVADLLVDVLRSDALHFGDRG